MQRIRSGVALLALALGFGLGRATAPAVDAELSTVASFRWALEEPDWLERTHRMSVFLQGLDPEKLPAALEAFEAQLPWVVTDELRLFMLAWSRFDPAGALERALAWAPEFRRSGSGAAIYAWAFRDGEAALRALASVEDAELRSFMERRLVAGWVHGAGKEGAARYIASLPDGPRRRLYIGKLAWELSKQGPDVVIAWAEEAPGADPRYRADVFLQAASALADVDPLTTATWLVRHLGRAYSVEAMRSLSRSWALRDPEAAMTWVADLPAGAGREGAVVGAFGVWLDQSPGDAEAWLRSATPRRALDPAVRLLLARHPASPGLAREWATAIEDPQLREQLVRGSESPTTTPTP